MAAHIDPVFRRCQEKAAENCPAKAIEHLVGVPADRIEAALRQADLATENQNPQQRENDAGQAGEAEKRTKADQPERVSRRKHDRDVEETGKVGSLATAAIRRFDLSERSRTTVSQSRKIRVLASSRVRARPIS